MGMGSLLLRSWLHKSSYSARQIFWVIQSNQNAIDKYKHYGFTEEDMIDIVLINKNLQYEAKDN
jgi:ribosomal protein S18 acetylase RimI-like enzyme